MRVLIISHMYPTEASPLSGIFVQKQAEALMAAGVELRLIHPTPWAPALLRWNARWRAYGAIPEQERHGELTVYHPRVVEFPRGLFFAQAPGRYRRGMAPRVAEIVDTWRPNLIHAHVAHPDGAAAVAFGARYRLPVVVTIHGQDFAQTLQKNEACARSVKGTLARADRVILVSDKLRTRYGLDQWATDLDKYRVIYNGVHLSDVVREVPPGVPAFNDDGSEGEAEPAEPVLLTVGFLRGAKGHAYVIQALPALVRTYPNLTYRIVGQGAERAALTQLAGDLGVQNHVVFCGELPHAAAMREMAACDVMVLPSWDEGFGVVYLEALAHAKPIIGTVGEGIAPLIERERVGLTVPPRDSAALARAIGALLADPAQARAMGVRGRTLVETQFTWDHNAEQTLSLYRELV